MIKARELDHPQSCLNKAAEDEPLFVLRAKDLSAPETIRFWVESRKRLRLNAYYDDQLNEALSIAGQMETWQRKQKENGQ